MKLKYLDQWTEGRRRNAERYQRLFAQAQLLDRVLLPVTTSGNFHVYNQYTVRVRQRDELRNFLKERASAPKSTIHCPCTCRIATATSAITRGHSPFRTRGGRSAVVAHLC